MKRERWTEADVKALATEEPDVFDRKSGRLLADTNAFQDAVAKALSAFANSGGGSLILGVEDDGTLTGLEPMVGRTPARDWIEQKVPALLDYPLSDFRVHTVEPASPSDIPAGKVVVVVDVGDSPLAPHQSKRDRHYYQRVGGRSLPASHFYLELLRQRLTSPELTFELTKAEPVWCGGHDGGTFIELKLTFHVTNVGRVAAYKWALRAASIRLNNEVDIQTVGSDFYFGSRNFPVHRERSSSISLDDTILPGQLRSHEAEVGIVIRPEHATQGCVTEEVNKKILDLVVTYHLATETSPGSPTEVFLRKALDPIAVIEAVTRRQA